MKFDSWTEVTIQQLQSDFNEDQTANIRKSLAHIYWYYLYPLK